MTNKIKTIASLLVAGATAAAVSANALPTPSTYTNVLQNVSIKLTVYSQGTTNASGTALKDVVATLATKDFIAGLGDALNTNFGRTATLVKSTIFTNDVIITPVELTNEESTNALSYTNLAVTFNGTNAYAMSVGSSLTISNGVIIGSSDVDGIIITNVSGSFTYEGSNGVVATNALPLDSNPGVTTTIAVQYDSALTNTNVVVLVSSNSISFTNVFDTGDTKIEVMSGTAAAPVFTDVTPFLRTLPDDNTSEVGSNNIVSQTGKNLTTTNAIVTTAGFIRIDHMDMGYFTTNSDSARNLYLVVQGFTKGALKLDTLRGGKDKVTEALSEGSFSSAVNGYGYIGGTTIVTNTGTPGGNTVDLPWVATHHEFVAGTNTLIQGYITNPVPVIVQGTISTTFLKNLPSH